MKVKLADLINRLQFTQKVLLGKTEAGEHPFMSPQASKLRTAPRSFVKNKDYNVQVLRLCAKHQLVKHKPKTNGYNSAVYNYNSLMRLAEMLSRVDETTKELEISEMEAIYFTDKDLEGRSLMGDFKYISASNPVFFASLAEILSAVMDSNDAKAREEKEKAEKKRSKGKKRSKKEKKKSRSSKDEESEEEDVETGSNSGETSAEQEVSSGSSSTSNPNGRSLPFSIPNLKTIGWLLLGLFVFLLAMRFFVPLFIGNNPVSTTGYIPETQVYQDPNLQSQVGPNGEVVLIPQGESQISEPSGLELSGKVNNFLAGVGNFWLLISEQAFWILMLLNLLAVFITFLDRSFDLEKEDFKVMMVALLGFTIWIVLPIGKWLFGVGLPTYWTVFGYQFLALSPEVMADGIGVLLLLVALAVASYSGTTDTTTASGGLFIAGNILFIAYIESFLTWRPPIIALGVWGLGGFIHFFFSLYPEEKVGQVLGLTAAGVIGQFVLFLLILQGIETTNSAWMLKNAQVISFGSSIFLAQIVVGVFLTLASESKLFSADGKIHNLIDNAAFDACLQMNYAALVILLLLWV